MSANKSKKIWGEDAEEWKPSRWLSPTSETTQRAHLPGVYSQMWVLPLTPPPPFFLCAI